MKVKNSMGRSSKPVDVDCHKVSCSYSGYMYLSECPSVIQLSLNVKTMNHPDLSVGWGSGGVGGIICSFTILLAAKLFIICRQIFNQKHNK